MGVIDLTDMNDNSDEIRKKKINSLAEEALRISKGRILANMRYLDQVIYGLAPVRSSYGPAADGRYIYYDPLDVLKKWKTGITTLSRDYMHMVLHCLFRHSFVREPIHRQHWDMAADMAAEALIDSLNMDCFDSPRGRRVSDYLNRHRDIVNDFTAEKLYAWLQGGVVSSAEMNRLRKIFSVDDHTMWYSYAASGSYSRDVELRDTDHGGEDGERVDGMTSDQWDMDEAELKKISEQMDGEDLLPEIVYSDLRKQIEDKWKDLSEYIQSDLSDADQDMGMGAGIMKDALEELNREHYDYDSFLRKFSLRGEAVRIDPDSFDYIFYTYGLKLYGNVPLIEPLEYGEEKKVRDLVIAVDTSGSTKGPVVRSFLKKTFNILKSEESFHRKVNLHIIQCDAEIQQDMVIHSLNDIDDFMENLEIRGYGGTDFRPVFTYVDALVKQGAFDHLKGLIYFTDGFGVFPRKKPEYETAFVFIDSGKNNLKVPAWAMKIVLGSEEV